MIYKKTKKKKQKRKKEKTRKKKLMNLDQVTQDLGRLAAAVKNFTETVEVAQTFGPEALPEAMACFEANAFSDLLDALGIAEEAQALRRWHLYADDEGEKIDNHPNWEEFIQESEQEE